VYIGQPKFNTMGLFSSVIHLYKSSQADIVNAISAELRETHDLSNISRISINEKNSQNIMADEVEKSEGLFYLVTQPHGNWTTIVELNVNIEDPIYLSQLANSLSKRLDTFALSIHLHDGDVLYYNLESSGESLDGYNSDYQYFLNEPAPKEEILSQRHNPEFFSPILPEGKDTKSLNAILNEGCWNAFDNNDLNEEGVPSDFDKYYVDEEERFERLGKYLEIFSKDEYPFANWYYKINRLNLTECHLLKANK
jgi:hypothetical protein